MRALLSVANRDGISVFARELQSLGIELYATDGTREHLAADGIESASVSDLTAIPSLVGGQVRTFHPEIYAGILARRDRADQLEQLAEHGIGLIDLVVVNVKPFAPEVGRHQIGIDEAIEMIDVAGAALLGAAARNAAGVIAVPGPATTRPCSRSSGAWASCPRTRATGWRPSRSAPSPPTTPRSPPTSTRSRTTSTRPVWRSCSRRSRTWPTARTRTSARRSTARPPTARGASRTRPRSTASRRPSTTCSTSMPRTASHPTTRRPRWSSPSTRTRSASRRPKSSWRRTGAHSTPIRCPRSAASSGSTASWTAPPRARSLPTPTRR